MAEDAPQAAADDARRRRVRPAAGGASKPKRPKTTAPGACGQITSRRVGAGVRGLRYSDGNLVLDDEVLVTVDEMADIMLESDYVRARGTERAKIVAAVATATSRVALPSDEDLGDRARSLLAMLVAGLANQMFVTAGQVAQESADPLMRVFYPAVMAWISVRDALWRRAGEKTEEYERRLAGEQSLKVAVTISTIHAGVAEKACATWFAQMLDVLTPQVFAGNSRWRALIVSLIPQWANPTMEHHAGTGAAANVIQVLSKALSREHNTAAENVEEIMGREARTQVHKIAALIAAVTPWV